MRVTIFTIIIHPYYSRSTTALQVIQYSIYRHWVSLCPSHFYSMWLFWHRHGTRPSRVNIQTMRLLFTCMITQSEEKMIMKNDLWREEKGKLLHKCDIARSHSFHKEETKSRKSSNRNVKIVYSTNYRRCLLLWPTNNRNILEISFGYDVICFMLQARFV